MYLLIIYAQHDRHTLPLQIRDFLTLLLLVISLDYFEGTAETNKATGAPEMNLSLF